MAAKVLIVGSEGRGHALGWKLAQSPQVEKVYFAPGNGGTGQVGENVDIKVDELGKLAAFAKKNDIDLTVVSPETPLVDGIADLFRSKNLPIFGPSAKAAMIEGSKVFSADFVLRHNIPHPASQAFNNLKEALSYIKDLPVSSYVIKADGLAAGKGVVVPRSKVEAEAALVSIMEDSLFGNAGRQVVIQQRLRGQEVSAFALSDGKNIAMLPFFQDHKQVFDGDKGPNTGGMGAYSPVPFITDKLAARIEKEIMQSAIDGMAADGTPFAGVLFAGLFITEDGDPMVIEYNCRFGDPECQTMMAYIDEDLYPLLLASAKGELVNRAVKTKPGAVATVMLASPGYPGDYPMGEEIFGLDALKDPDIHVFHAGTKLDDGKLVTAGGRVLGLTASGSDMKDALHKIYSHIGPGGAYFKDMHYRTDIGHRVL